jgi:hypothetical protein
MSRSLQGLPYLPDDIVWDFSVVRLCDAAGYAFLSKSHATGYNMRIEGVT